ncbi:MAG TPA: tetratricopeptide repeat protein [Blastocatellia bacterium]|nr:tetratricopeptide repeat protein [Blastocatellia bacterium]
MRRSLLQAVTAALLILLVSIISNAQTGGAPPSIQIFMPDGSLPPREVRFQLVSEDGRVETFYTDTKGRFLITRSEGLRPNVRYTITVQGDGLTYDTTVVSFKEYNVYYIPVFLRPIKPDVVKPAGVIDLAEIDSASPPDAREAYENGLKAIRTNQPDEAVREMNRAIEIYPNYFRALNDLGVLLMKLNRLDEAASAFERASSLAPRIYYPRLNLAIVRTRQAKYKDAITILDKLHKENPGVVEIRTPLADALMAAGNLDEAERHLRSALSDKRLDRDSSGNTYYLLGLLLNRKQKPAEAVAALQTAAKIIPGGPRIHLQLGGALLQLKRYEEAERELKEAYRLSGPELGAAQFLLGEVYFMTGKYESAMRAFEQYLADVPKAPNTAEVRALIDKIKAALNPK